MSIDRVVQPLVACLGNPVAGNPTQFVMTRISRDAELDWRFFTSEVAPTEFETAFRGVQALGMAGLAILEPFQEQAVGYLDSLSEIASLMGRVNVARQEGNAWIGDHTYGSALMLLLRTRLSVQPLREDGTMSPQSIAVLGSPQTARIIDCLLRSLDGDFSVLVCGENGSEPSIALDGSDLNASAGSVQTVTLEEMSSLERPVRVLVIEDESRQTVRPKAMLKWLQQIAWASSPVVVCSNVARQLGTSALEWLKGREVHMAEELELMAYQAAVDFHFWTGCEPSIELIRESLEEYLQW